MDNPSAFAEDIKEAGTSIVEMPISDWRTRWIWGRLGRRTGEIPNAASKGPAPYRSAPPDYRRHSHDPI